MALVASALFDPEAPPAPPLGAPVPAFVVLPAALFEPGLAGLPTTEAGLAARRVHLGSYVVPAATQAALRALLASRALALAYRR